MAALETGNEERMVYGLTMHRERAAGLLFSSVLSAGLPTR